MGRQRKGRTTVTATKEQTERGVELVREMINRLGFAAEVSEGEGDRGISVKVKTDDPGRIIGRKGKYLDSVELLVNSIMRKEDRSAPRVGIDVDGYERKKAQTGGRRGGGGGGGGGRRGRGRGGDDEVLARQATDMAKEVKKWGEPRSTGPLSARDRRVIHMTLKGDADVATVSGEDEGDGRKRVTVRLADAR